MKRPDTIWPLVGIVLCVYNVAVFFTDFKPGNLAFAALWALLAWWAWEDEDD